MTYPTDLSLTQARYILEKFPEILNTKTKENVIHILNGLLYLIKTGCQWRMLPKSFPSWRKVYYSFRRWSDIGLFSRMMTDLNAMARDSQQKEPEVSVAVIDSESVRWGLPHSEKGVDGGKKVKGIKRHIAVDDMGFPLAVVTTKGNVHDSKAASELIYKTITDFVSIKSIKADNGYRGALVSELPKKTGVELLCVKSNFGESGFRPIDGRWVVERTFSWLSTFRRLCRNYEQYLHTARSMAEAACVMFMLRYC